MNTTTSLGDKPINRMGYGAMQLAGPGVFGPPRDPGTARAVLRRRAGRLCP
jgi:pyridoxine 4-dehydrogenase